MPKNGYKAITVPKSLFDALNDHAQNRDMSLPKYLSLADKSVGKKRAERRVKELNRVLNELMGNGKT